jgi:DNA-binding NarL/FixJ family response regulator
LDRILITDDHPLVRNGICALLGSALADCEIEEASSLRDAIARLSSGAEFDLVTLDLDLPDAKQLQALTSLRGRFPSVPIAILSASKDPYLARAAVSVGAAGFISKSDHPDTLVSAVRSILACGTYAGPAEARLDEGEMEVRRKVGALTPQQHTVFEMISEGLQNKQIAHRLGISISTVKLHVSAVLVKLEVASRTQATILAKTYHIFS